MSHVREWRLALEVRRKHGAGIVGGSSVLVVLLFLILAAVEVGRTFVLVRAAVLLQDAVSVGVAPKYKALPALTYVHRVMSSRMSDEEYSYNFLLLPKMKTATSTEQSTESS